MEGSSSRFQSLISVTPSLRSSRLGSLQATWTQIGPRLRQTICMWLRTSLSHRSLGACSIFWSMVSRRRRLLDYVKRHNPEQYIELLKRLEIRK